MGVLSLDHLVKALFGESIEDPLPIIQPKQLSVIDRTLCGEMKIEEFNKAFNANINLEGCEDLGELVEDALGHLPEKGELVRIGPFEHAHRRDLLKAMSKNYGSVLLFDKLITAFKSKI